MTNLLNTGLYSDLTLIFCDETSSDALFSLDVHYTILYMSGILYFRNLIDNRFGGSIKKINNKDTLNIYLNFDLYNQQMIRHVFEFIYMGDIREELLNETTIHYINNHLLYFHQLSLYFTFVTLEEYCLEKIYSEMSVEIFESLSTYCLSQNVSHSERYNIIGDKLALYNRMIQWHQYCIDKPIIPDIMDNHGFLVHHQKLVDNFNIVSLPKKSITSHDSYIHYYHNICRNCLHSKKNTFFNAYNVYLGGLISLDKKKSCHFSVMRQQDKRNHFDLFIAYSSSSSSSSSSSLENNATDSMSVESSSHSSHDESSSSSSSSPLMHIKLSLFSKKLCLDKIETTQCIDDLTRVLSFNLHDKKYCYAARCIQCQEHKPVYIIDITIDPVK